MSKIFFTSILTVLLLTTNYSTPLHSQTTAEDPVLIAELKAQIQSLIKQIQAIILARSQGTLPSFGSASFTQDLTIGSGGSQVVSLQQFLVSKGYMVMPPGVAYGYFGPLTASSVTKFQSAYAISPASGYVGP
ncbi:MAG: peptidoglycan-binding domain-containing protein, partial [Minisyncoccota bacterium]